MYGKYEVRTDDELRIFVDLSSDDLTSVHITHITSGASAVGHAKKHPDDPYDENVGKSIAYYRAQQRLSRKLERGLIRALPAGV